MNRLHRDCFSFAAATTLLAGCVPILITEPDTNIQKAIKADGRGGIVEDNKNLQLASPTRDGFTVIGGPQTQEIKGAIDPEPTRSPSTLKGVGPSPRQKLYHIKYNNIILAALSSKPPSQSIAAPANNQNAGYLRYRIWIPTDDSDNIGEWSAWTTSNQPPDMDSSSPSLSGTLLQSGKWQLVSPDSLPPKTIRIQATVTDSTGKETQITWTGVWMLGPPPDPIGRGYIKWSSP